jgi:hypothetical protein
MQCNAVQAENLQYIREKLTSAEERDVIGILPALNFDFVPKKRIYLLT